MSRPGRDYLVEAARQLRLALERDVSEDYEEAFNHYQNGVDVLLRGVQAEPNRERREAVKRKITQYLRRAEEIFTCHLQRALGDGSPGGTSLPKSFVETRERQTIIPHGVPFMVKLLCYYASEDSIFLHLEHVQGETLWSHLRAKYCTQHGPSSSSSSPCTTATQAVQGHRRENSEDSAQGSSHSSADQAASAPSPDHCEQGLVFHTWNSVTAGEAKGCMFAKAASQHEPRALSGQTTSLPRGRAPAPSGLRRTPASWGHGHKAWAVKEEQVQLWAAEILLALEGLHQQGVLCRDLNPRNLLLDTAGHVRLTFFGQWTEVEPQCCSQAVEQLYSAPATVSKPPNRDLPSHPAASARGSQHGSHITTHSAPAAQPQTAFGCRRRWNCQAQVPLFLQHHPLEQAGGLSSGSSRGCVPPKACEPTERLCLQWGEVCLQRERACMRFCSLKSSFVAAYAC
ncbi:ribosomal protein S6 kinase-like 1 isoform X3 [Cyrtonyx montezumae]|uniref:ribosomal protein S6 kinase-like 1 isoform X3 n=1 Tax=Cyrtonyx montezumae TaxID=9017 RepID=UPI0032DA8EFB